MQVAYVGNHGSRMNVSQNINLPSTYGGGNASLPENSTAFTGGATGRTAATNEYFLGDTSNYHSLQAQLTKRVSGGLSFTSAFTWGKVLNYATGGDDNGGLVFFINTRRNYAPADFDRAKNFEQSFNYELPAGRGHKFFSSGIGNLALGGWRLTGVLSMVSGLPFTVYANGGTLNTHWNCTDPQSSPAARACSTTSAPANSGLTQRCFHNPRAARDRPRHVRIPALATRAETSSAARLIFRTTSRSPRASRSITKWRLRFASMQCS